VFQRDLHDLGFVSRQVRRLAPRVVEQDREVVEPI
jgi:hypothetical protein